MGLDVTALVRAAEKRATGAWRASEIHGDLHSRQVARIGHWLPRVIPAAAKADRDVVTAFAILHDAQRQNDGHDPEHGRRAAKVAKAMKQDGVLDLADDQIKTLRYALKHHAEGNTHTDPTIGTCWDADRLSLLRMQIRPSLRKLSTIHTRDEMKAAITAATVTVLAADLPWEAVLTKARSDTILYHGTTATNAASIRREGLKEAAPGRGVYFSPSREIARDFFIRSAVRELQRARIQPDAGLLIHARFAPSVEFVSQDAGVYGFCVPWPVVRPDYFIQVEQLDVVEELRRLQAKRRAAREAE